jgi:hypothetical protein
LRRRFEQVGGVGADPRAAELSATLLPPAASQTVRAMLEIPITPSSTIVENAMMSG